MRPDRPRASSRPSGSLKLLIALSEPSNPFCSERARNATAQSCSESEVETKGYGTQSLHFPDSTEVSVRGCRAKTMPNPLPFTPQFSTDVVRYSRLRGGYDHRLTLPFLREGQLATSKAGQGPYSREWKATRAFPALRRLAHGTIQTGGSCWPFVYCFVPCGRNRQFASSVLECRASLVCGGRWPGSSRTQR